MPAWCAGWDEPKLNGCDLVESCPVSARAIAFTALNSDLPPSLPIHRGPPRPMAVAHGARAVCLCGSGLGGGRPVPPGAAGLQFRGGAAAGHRAGVAVPRPALGRGPCLGRERPAAAAALALGLDRLLALDRQRRRVLDCCSRNTLRAPAPRARRRRPPSWCSVRERPAARCRSCWRPGWTWPSNARKPTPRRGHRQRRPRLQRVAQRGRGDGGYLRARGLPPARIAQEERSTSTAQNLALLARPAGTRRASWWHAIRWKW
jgi:hypothetical protein